jgi:hypothetical protein
MSEVKPPALRDISRPLATSGRGEISQEDARRLGLLGPISPEALADIERMEEEQRSARMRLRHLLVD